MPMAIPAALALAGTVGGEAIGTGLLATTLGATAAGAIGGGLGGLLGNTVGDVATNQPITPTGEILSAAGGAIGGGEMAGSAGDVSGGLGSAVGDADASASGAAPAVSDGLGSAVGSATAGTPDAGGAALPSATQAATTAAATPATGAAGGVAGGFMAPGAASAPVVGGASALSGPAALGLTSQDVFSPAADTLVPAATGAADTGATGAASGAADAGAAAAAGGSPSGAGGTLSSLISKPNFLLPAAALGFEALNQPSMPSPQNLTSQLSALAGPQQAAGTSLINTGEGVIGQGQGLVQPLATGAGPGSLPSGAESEINQAVASAKASIRSQYAGMGLSGSTMEAQALAEIDQNAITQRFQVAQQMAQTGLNEIQTGQGVVGGGVQATGGAASIYNNLLNQSLQQDQALQSAVSNFAGQVARSQAPIQLATLASLNG